MHRMLLRLLPFLISSIGFTERAVAQNYPYIVKSFAGSFNLGDGGPAASALLSQPNGVIVDSAGVTYILDAGNYLIRRIAANGTISTSTPLSDYGYDIRLAPDGKSFYMAAFGRVYQVSPGSAPKVIAGTGTSGFSGDGGPAISAQVGQVSQLALDSSGNIYLADTTNHRIRKITIADGKIQTIAGTGTAGFSGDNGQATSAAIALPYGVAFDNSTNALFFSDSYNSRIRRVGSDGVITTVVGSGVYGRAADGIARNTPMGTPVGLSVDGSGSVFIADYDYGLILKYTPSANTVVRLAGNFSLGGPYDDAVSAKSTSFLYIAGCAVDNSGNVLVVDYTHRVRKIGASDGLVTAVAGKQHFAGDGGPAVNALLNSPRDVAFDTRGNVFVADSNNFRIRRIAPDGSISTYAGTATAGFPNDNTPIQSGSLPQIQGLTSDTAGNLYLTAPTLVLRISNFTYSYFAGTGFSGNGGDRGPANRATFTSLTGIAADASGNVYIADSGANRIRKVAPDGTISAFAGTGATGFSGDGGLATAATLRLSSTASPIAVDKDGNVYFADGLNYRIRMVTPSGIISTYAGNGNFGNPNKSSAKTSALSRVGGMTVDPSGNLFATSIDYPATYRIAKDGTITRIGGTTAAPFQENVDANSVVSGGYGMRADANGDLYVADPTSSVVRKLTLNSPVSFGVADGNNQTGTAGTVLTKPLKVTVMGRAGVGVLGVPVDFNVSSGRATLSTQSTVTDDTGTAAVVVTLGANTGPVVVTATASGTTLPAVQFNLTARSSDPNCTIGPPNLVSARSLADFGGSAAFSSGTWLELKGTNLAVNTRLWGGADFSGSNAPTRLDSTTVSLNGKAGFVEYISPTQINVQAPADPATGQVQVSVSNCAGTSNALTLQKNTITPGLLAPSAFNIGGKQYVAALFLDGVTFVGDTDLIPGVAFKPAKPGDSIAIYAIGMGSVSPDSSPGVVVGQLNAIPGFSLSFDQTPATVGYAGLAIGTIGLYQFNVTVPTVPDGDYPIRVTAGGVALTQTAYLTVRN